MHRETKLMQKNLTLSSLHMSRVVAND